MANNTADNNQDFDEDLDEEFIDDFGTETLDSKDKDALSASNPLAANRRAPTQDSAKNLINMAIIGSVALSLTYFGYSYYKKSHIARKELAQQIHISKDLTSTEQASTSNNMPTSSNKTLGSASKIEDLEFELNPLDKNLPAASKNSQARSNPSLTTTPNLNATIASTSKDSAETLTHSAKIEDLAQALAPDNFKVLQPVEDLFDSDVTQAQANKTMSAKPHDEVKDTLASMAEEITLNVNHIHQLETTITQINKSLDELTSAITKLDHKLSTIGDGLTTLDQDISNVKKVISNQDLDLATMPNKISHQSAGKEPLVYSTPDYVVHAIIPGRAWLKSTGGQIITITEGDQIGDYGKVASIDATNNIVRTSSGITFR